MYKFTPRDIGCNRIGGSKIGDPIFISPEVRNPIYVASEEELKTVLSTWYSFDLDKFEIDGEYVTNFLVIGYWKEVPDDEVGMSEDDLKYHNWQKKILDKSKSS